MGLWYYGTQEAYVVTASGLHVGGHLLSPPYPLFGPPQKLAADLLLLWTTESGQESEKTSTQWDLVCRKGLDCCLPSLATMDHEIGQILPFLPQFVCLYSTQ
jgi:hypothetical protein